jgi:hypothetical protein
MLNYLIEIPYSKNSFECKQMINLFVESGAHLLANTQWVANPASTNPGLSVILTAKKKRFRLSLRFTA